MERVATHKVSDRIPGLGTFLKSLLNTAGPAARGPEMIFENIERENEVKLKK